MDVSKFLQKLFYMAVHPAGRGLVHWAADGRSLRVSRSAQAMEPYLGRFFQSGALSSFMRQLSYYKFRQVGRQVDRKTPQTKSAGKEAGFATYTHAAFDVSATRLGEVVRERARSRSTGL